MRQSWLQCGFAIVTGRRESPRFAAACDPGAIRGSGVSQVRRKDPRTGVHLYGVAEARWSILAVALVRLGRLLIP